jgi:hypothetical protein
MTKPPAGQPSWPPPARAAVVPAQIPSRVRSWTYRCRLLPSRDPRGPSRGAFLGESVRRPRVRSDSRSQSPPQPPGFDLAGVRPPSLVRRDPHAPPGWPARARAQEPGADRNSVLNRARARHPPARGAHSSDAESSHSELPRRGPQRHRSPKRTLSRARTLPVAGRVAQSTASQRVSQAGVPAPSTSWRRG